jgi:choline dehydrogenase-like flavoprotein
VSGILAEPPERIRAQVVVVGSGPGGSITACLLAEAGRSVVLVEDGPYLPLESCAAFSREEMLQKYRCGGVTAAIGNPKVTYVEARCVGGGSEINSGLYHRTPPDVLDAWRSRFDLQSASEADLEPHFRACEEDLSVSRMPGTLPAASLKLHEGATALGWKSLEVPRWFRYEATGGAGETPHGRRQSMTATFAPRALAAGCTLLPDTRVLRLRAYGGRWTVLGAHAPNGRSPRQVDIEAETVFVCGGAVQTPALLRRSGITRHVGNTLGMHPTIKVIALFPEEVNAPDMGVPVHQVKEFAPRVSFGCSISSPPYLALAMLDHPEHAGTVDRTWRHMAVYYAMITGGSGTVRPLPSFSDPLVRYRLTDADLADLRGALIDLCRCLFAAGATRLYPSINCGPILERPGDLEALRGEIPRDRLSIMTVHLFGSCPMGEDRAVCAADSFGRVHDVPGLHLADASLLCGAPGVNPQGSIMAFARRNALAFLGEL